MSVSGEGAGRRLVLRPWALHLRSLGFCDHECVWGALRHACNEVVVASGVGWRLAMSLGLCAEACRESFDMAPCVRSGDLFIWPV